MQIIQQLNEKIKERNHELENKIKLNENNKYIIEQNHIKNEIELKIINTDIENKINNLELLLQNEKNQLNILKNENIKINNELFNKIKLCEEINILYNEKNDLNINLTNEINQLNKNHIDFIEKYKKEINILNEDYNNKELLYTNNEIKLKEKIESLENSLININNEYKNNNAILIEEKNNYNNLNNKILEINNELNSIKEDNIIKKKEIEKITKSNLEYININTILNEKEIELNKQIIILNENNKKYLNDYNDIKQNNYDKDIKIKEIMDKLATAENEIHYLQNIAIPDLNNSALDTVERSKNEQVGYSIVFYIYILL